jgi:hypothetical protein
MMKRLHLFEFNDQPWLPAVLRDGARGYLATLCRKLKVHETMAPHLERLLTESGSGKIVDLCAGAGGPLRDILPLLASPPETIQTDLHPFHGLHPEPVDALAVPAQLEGTRTLFNAFHHFQPEQAKQILADAVEARQPIGVFELVERRWLTVLSAPSIVLFSLVVMPMVRPFRWQYLLFTYILPILPLIIMWDGLVSHLRCHTETEVLALAESIGAEDWKWETHTPTMGPGKLTILLGWPQ